jgi:hypothetical protein
MTDQEAQAEIMRIMDAFIAEQTAAGGVLSCIASGAALLNVLHGLGYDKAYALTVEARVMNPIATRYAEQCGWQTGVGDAPEGSVMVSVGPETGDVGLGNWAGHLVVILPGFLGERHILLDPTIMQANKAGSGINLPPISVTVRDDVTSGEKIRKLAVNGSTVMYKARPDDRSYREGSGWDRIRKDVVLSDRVLAALASPSS